MLLLCRPSALGRACCPFLFVTVLSSMFLVGGVNQYIWEHLASLSGAFKNWLSSSLHLSNTYLLVWLWPSCLRFYNTLTIHRPSVMVPGSYTQCFVFLIHLGGVVFSIPRVMDSLVLFTLLFLVILACSWVFAPAFCVFNK